MNKIFKYQLWHLLALITMLFCLSYYPSIDVHFLEGSFFQMETYSWYVIAILVPILHQIYVLLIWRYELHFKSISNYFGEKGFTLFKAGFALFMLSRILSIIALAVSNRMTLSLDPILTYALSAILFIPAAYLFYSVAKYFGIDRAVGKDHFDPAEAKAASFVRQGIFKYTANGMYKYGVLILWIPGILLQSQAAIAVALFSHVYIWVHYYFTELPDIRVIYGEGVQEQ